MPKGPREALESAVFVIPDGFVIIRSVSLGLLYSIGCAYQALIQVTNDAC